MNLLDVTTLSAEPTVPPGESPFHVKGIAYLGHMTWVDTSFPGGRPAFMAALAPSVRGFFEQTFLAVSTFDLVPLACAGVTCAKVLRMSLGDFVTMRSSHQAKQDLNGVYRTLLRLSSTRLIATRLPALLAQYFDFGQTRLVNSADYHVSFEIEPVPTLLVEWLKSCYLGYMEVVMTSAGCVAPNLEVTHQSMGKFKGAPASKLQLELRWS